MDPDSTAHPFTPPGADLMALPEPLLLALSLAIGVMLVGTPLCAFFYARANRHAWPHHRVLFGSAMVSAGATTAWMALLVIAPGIVRTVPLHMMILPFVTLFLWAWTLLDFTRGLRLAGLGPRRWSLSVIGLGTGLALVFVLPLFALQ